jgi:hypothetical protein
MDNQTLLTAIDAAITALLTGGHSSYSVEGRTVTRLDLNSLFQQREKLSALVEWDSASQVKLAKFGRTRP